MTMSLDKFVAVTPTFRSSPGLIVTLLLTLQPVTLGFAIHHPFHKTFDKFSINMASSTANSNNDYSNRKSSSNNKLDNDNMKIRFVTNRQCPFAHKVWLALECSSTYKSKYQLEEISLYGSNGKPDWFWKLNPKGTVPVLVVESLVTSGNKNKSKVLTDSDSILDYFETSDDDTLALYSDDPKIQQSIHDWRRRINDMLPIGKTAILSSSYNKLETLLKDLDDTLAKQQQSNTNGPFLAGTTHATTADCHAFPFVWRLEKEIDLRKYQSLHSWLQHCKQQPAFKHTIQISSWWWWW